MLKRMAVFLISAAAPVGAAHAATIVLLPEPGSMSPPTIIVDPRAGNGDPVLVCASPAQLAAGGCILRHRTSGPRQGG